MPSEKVCLNIEVFRHQVFWITIVATKPKHHGRILGCLQPPDKRTTVHFHIMPLPRLIMPPPLRSHSSSLFVVFILNETKPPLSLPALHPCPLIWCRSGPGLVYFQGRAEGAWQGYEVLLLHVLCTGFGLCELHSLSVPIAALLISWAFQFNSRFMNSLTTHCTL